MRRVNYPLANIFRNQRHLTVGKKIPSIPLRYEGEGKGIKGAITDTPGIVPISRWLLPLEMLDFVFSLES
jgi:hypothetical protein